MGFRIPTLRPASLAMARMRRALAKFPVWEAGVYLLEKKVRAVGPRIPCGRRPADAAHCESIVAEPNCGSRFVFEFYQITLQTKLRDS